MDSFSQAAFDEAFENSARVQYVEDCKKICAVAASVAIEMTPSQAEAVWAHFSEAGQSGWLALGEDKEVLLAIEVFIADYR
jgi:hypothetical protein